MRPKYRPPYLREDGTFSVIRKFKTIQNAADLHDPVTAWFEQWFVDHVHWKDPTEEIIRIDKGPWNYVEIFTGTPYVIKAEYNQLWIRLDARLYSYWWRDWFVPMMVDLQETFQGLEHEGNLFFIGDE